MQRMLGRAEKYSILKLGPNFSVDLRLNTHYEYWPTAIIISHLSYLSCHLSCKPAYQKHITNLR